MTSVHTNVDRPVTVNVAVVLTPAKAAVMVTLVVLATTLVVTVKVAVV